jgi:hypothetical protein
VVQALDFGKGGWWAVSLRLVLPAAFGFGEGISENGGILVAWQIWAFG